MPVMKPFPVSSSTVPTSLGLPERRSMAEQRASLPIYSLKQELINAVRENQVDVGR